MEISDFLTPDRVLLEVRARDKNQLINEIARALGRLVPGLTPEAVQTALSAREQLGSRIEGLGAYVGLFVRLAKPIDFDAIDGKPVTLVFVLLIPSETTMPHVAALAAISRKFRDADLVTSLRQAKTHVEAYSFLTKS
jgi:nitrogen PTS system EIIA component